jgi:2-polyprenyl-3-methyl-5-hydroxy-6-metoxy-1,4-benzoquinol methylase
MTDNPNISDRLLSERFEDDGIPIYGIAKGEQEEALSAHLEKLRSGRYAYESVACAVCGGSECEQLARKDRYGIPLSVCICRACGLIRTEPRLRQQDYDDFYASDYRALYVGKAVADEAFFNDQYAHGLEIVSFVRRAGLAIDRNLLVVEVGAGAGGILAAFKEQGADVLGCDLGDSYLEFGRQRGLNLVQGSLSQLDTGGRKIGLIIYSHVLEHVLNPRAELALVKDRLASDGRVYVEIPSVKNLHKTVYVGDLLKLLQNAHTYHFSGQSLRNLMAVNGFRCVLGDEFVHAVFAPASPAPWSSDYGRVMAYLARAERWRGFEWLRPYHLAASAKAVIRSAQRRLMPKR